VINKLVAERRVSNTEIDRYLSDMGREISELEERLNALREAQGQGGGGGWGRAAAATAPAPQAPVRRRRRRSRSAAATKQSAAPSASQPRRRRRGRKAITSDQMASRQLQGRYLSLVRRFPANKRPQFAKIAKDRGREAAIREMQQQLPK
jgi:hypothetical protein